MVDDWRPLRDGSAPEVILAVDFESGRAEPGLRDLMGVLDVPQAVWQPAPTGQSLDGSPDAYVQGWLAHVRERGWQVAAVLGYCAGAGLAVELAARLVGPAGRPAVALIDPYPVDAPMLGYQFMAAVQQFEATLDEAELLTLRQRVRAVCQNAEPPAAAAALVDEYTRITTRAFADLGLEPEIGDEFCARFRQYLAYLVTSWRCGYAGADEQSLILLSAEQGVPAGLPGRAVRLPLPRHKLLTSPEAGALISAAVRGGSQPASPEVEATGP